MADRFWVGGAASWDATAGTKWAATSGGAGGQSVPTSADAVFFDAASGAVTCTIAAGNTGALSINCTGFTGTLAGSANLVVSGSVTLFSGMSFTYNGALFLESISTLTSAGKTFAGSVNFGNFTGTYTLGDALTCSSSIQFNVGTFNSANFNITATQFGIGNSNPKTLNLGSSTVTLQGAAPINFTIITNLIFNAGTSTINCTSTNSTVTINSGTVTSGIVYNNVSFTGNTAGARSISGRNTFNSFAVTGPASAGAVTVNFFAQQTINGTLSTTGTAGNRRVFFATANYGISHDLVVNSAPSLTDADFRGLYVRGTAAPISGTRIGNRGECRGITFSTPKTVYRNLAGTQNWSANGWATTSTGTPSTDNFPLPQDTATFTNDGAWGVINLDSAIGYVPNVDMSGRTNLASVVFSTANICYGNWTNGSGVNFLGVGTLIFAGGTTQTITSAGKTFTCPITIDTYGGTVQLADALNIGGNTLTVTNGAFNTAGYAVTAGFLASNNSNVRTITFGASTLTFTVSGGTALDINTTNLTFNSGTSQVNSSGSGGGGVSNTGSIVLALYNFSITSTAATTSTIVGLFNFNNLTVTAPASANLSRLDVNANITISGTLTCAGASAVRRVFLQSNIIGTPRTLTVNAISATDCDFRDIVITGAAAGSSPTRAGDCGGNTGITFPAPKTVYWNLAGTNSWLATGWAASSGGTPDINQFPLAQDTAVFDNAGAITEIRLQSNVIVSGINAANRTTAMALNSFGGNSGIYGSIVLGSGVTVTSTSNPIAFSRNGTHTITSNGIQFGCPIAVSHPLANVQLADALSLNSAATLTLNAGTFDAVTYNVTAGAVANNATSTTLRMGSGTWTLTGTGLVWNLSNAPTLVAGTSNIVLSNTSTSSRTFQGGSLYYNKLTIGGTTGTATLTITGGNTFGELASTKTVAHTIDFGGNAQTFGKWSVTGTAGNVVTITGTSTTNFIAGPAVTGVDYLAMGTWGVSTNSPGEFYAGANSTGTAAAPVFRTAAPAPRTLYWVGGTGNWSSTTKWDTTSGGGGGAAIPTSLDAVNFNSASNATAYTATIDAGVTLARCASFTMAGPASGNVTFAGTVGIAFHGNVSFAATGITRTYTGTMNLTGNSSYTFTTNGVLFASQPTVSGIGATWTLGSALTLTGGAGVSVTSGTFDTSTSNYSMNVSSLSLNGTATRVVNLRGSTISISGTSIIFLTNTSNLTFNAGTSTINSSSSGVVTVQDFSNSGLTFYNLFFTPVNATSIEITGPYTFNTLSFAGRTSVGITPVTFSANQTISTLTLNAGTASAFRTFLASNTIGTPRTLTVGTLTAGAADIDFRDITIAGAAAPLTGTRFGNARGNSGITFPAAKTVYWALATSNNWGNTGAGSWSATSGGSAAADQFPLAQDTAFIPFAIPNNNQTITVNANYNIGTLDMNERNGSALVTLTTSTNSPAIYGNWINGTGTTLTGNGTITFAGRVSQTITNAGKVFSANPTIDSPGGTVTLADAFTVNGTFTTLTRGTFNLAGYTATVFQFQSSNSNTRVLNFGTNGLISNSSGWSVTTSTNLTVTGTGTISMTSGGSQSFNGGSANYSGITLNQGGAGTLTITGNNTFANITNTYSATGATTINLGATTQTLTQPWTATGAAGRVLTLNGTSAASPAALRFTGAGTAANVDYLAINNVRAYDIFDEWYAGPNSTNGGSLGWYFATGPGNVYAVFITESASGVDAVLATSTAIYNSSVSETGSVADAALAASVLGSSVIESASGIDAVSALAALSGVVAESASGIDVISALASLGIAVSEAASGIDTQTTTVTLLSSIAEAASAIDATTGGAVFVPIISESASGVDTVSSSLQLGGAVAETSSGVDAVSALASFGGAVSEASSGVDAVSALAALGSAVSEAASGLDAVAAGLAALSSAVAESASSVDAVASSAVFASSASESASGLDTVSSSAQFGGVVAETASGVDAASAIASLGSAVSEAASGVDAVASSPVYTQSIIEAASGVEAIAGTAVFISSTSESASGLDSVTGFSGTGRSVSETATAVTSIDSSAILGGTITENSSGVDAVSSVGSFGGAVSEAASGIDTVTAIRAVPGAVSETASGVDSNSAAAVFTSSTSEAASGIDAASALMVRLGAVNETASGIDAVSSVALFGGAVSEAASGVDAVSSVTARSGVITETASGADSNVASAVFTSAAVENASGVDSASALTVRLSAVAEAASGLDSNAAIAVFTSSASEAASGVDAVSSRAEFGGRVAETASGIDSTVGFIRFPTSVAETASGVDSVAGTQTLVASAAEAASGLDSASTRVSVGGVVSETSSGADAASALASLGSAISEAARGVDAVAPAVIQSGSIAETASGVDSLSAIRVVSAVVSETSSAQDITQAAFLVTARINELSTGTDQISALRTRSGVIAESAILYEGNIISTSYDTPGAGTYTVPSGVTTVVAELWGGGGGGGQGESTEDGGGGGSGAYARKATPVTPGQVLSFTVGSAGTGQTDFPLPIAPSTSGTASSYSTVSAGGGIRGVNGLGGAGGAATGGDVNLSGGNGVVTAGGIAPFSSGSIPGGGGNGGVYAGIFNAPGGNGTVGRVRFSYASGTPTASVVFVGQLQEALAAQDSVNAPGSTYNAPVVELAQLSDAAQAAATFPSSVAETATGEETNSAAFIPLAAISESATATDVTSALAVFAAQTAESASIADEVSPPGSIYNAVVLAVAQMLDSVNAPGSIYNAQVLESSTLADSLIGAYLWNLIDNAENADWGTIDVAQVTSWGVIDAAQPADWQVVENYFDVGGGGDSSYAGAAFGEVPFAGGGSGIGTGWVEIETDTPVAWTVVRSIL